MSYKNAHKYGYKPSPLCWIPKEWKDLTIADVVTFSGGSQPPQSTFVNKPKEGYIRLVQTRDYRTDRYPTFIPVHLAKKLCKKDDIMVGRYGPPLFQVFKGLEGAYNVALIKALPNESLVDKEYCYYYLTRPELRFYLEGLSQRSGGQTGIEMDRLNEYPFPVPSCNERKRIVSILKISDEAISKTQQLIAQLQQRNKGLMQQLLTGKKRLKGFEKTKWNKQNADAIFKSVSIKNNGNEQLLSATQDRGIIPRDMLSGRVTMPSGETNTYKLVEPGNFIISLRSFQGGLEYSEYSGIVSPAYTVLKPIKSIDDAFYKYYFKSYDFIGHLAVTVIGIRDGKQISFDDFCVLRLPYPSVEEQKAIAEILNKAENEVKLNQQKLCTLEQQKKGLMQKLLTGEVRVKI